MPSLHCPLIHSGLYVDFSTLQKENAVIYSSCCLMDWTGGHKSTKLPISEDF